MTLLIQNLLTILGVIVCGTGVGVFVRRGSTLSALTLMQKNIEGYKAAIDLEALRQKNLTDQVAAEQLLRVAAEKAAFLAQQTQAKEEKRSAELAAIIANHELERQAWQKEKAQILQRVADLEAQVRVLQDRLNQKL